MKAFEEEENKKLSDEFRRKVVSKNRERETRFNDCVP